MRSWCSFFIRGSVRGYGFVVAQAYGISLLRQLALLIILRVRYGTSADDFYRYRLYLKTSKEASGFLVLSSHIKQREQLYRKLSIAKEPLADKRLFYRRCNSVGLPIPETVAEFEGGDIRWWSERQLPRCDLFVKEGASLCGAGAARWDFAGDNKWKGADGRLLDEVELLRELCDQSHSVMMVLQRRVKNHPDLAAFGPAGLCTVRIVTIREPGDDSPHLLLAAFRMPTGGNVADNFARGGLACPVDLTTGTLGLATYKALSLAHLDVSKHPDTGIIIPGRELPNWKQVRELAICAHHVFAEFPSVGWDIAVTPEGPVLVEGNYNWDIVIAQQAGCRPLGATRFADHQKFWHQWVEPESGS
jgi:hypothetical protein